MSSQDKFLIYFLVSFAFLDPALFQRKKGIAKKYGTPNSAPCDCVAFAEGGLWLKQLNRW
jgi:hypothetical protein